MNRAWITAAETMGILGITKWSLARLRKSKRLRFRAANRRVFAYRAADVRALSQRIPTV